MVEELQRRNFAPGTIRAYVHRVEHYSRLQELSGPECDCTGFAFITDSESIPVGRNKNSNQLSFSLRFSG